MHSLLVNSALLDWKSSDLGLSHPTSQECIAIWTKSSTEWKDSLSLPVYLQESQFLTTVPLAREGGMTNWILVDKNSSPDQRIIYCSCESFRKRSLTSDTSGSISEGIVHGIASVYCPPIYRGRGYGQRLMSELAKTLYFWQSRDVECLGSILYSDIGKNYYANLGWQPNISNFHLTFQPSEAPKQQLHRPIPVVELSELCQIDETMIWEGMRSVSDVGLRMTIIPDLDHMLWHISKEDFTCNLLFGKVPEAKGAIAGAPGNRVWAVWTHRYYKHPDTRPGSNTLYILRLVFENSEALDSATVGDERDHRADFINEQVGYLKAVLNAAQAEATAWKLDQVELWEPTTAVQKLIARTKIGNKIVERTEYSIASVLWYAKDGERPVMPQWLNNEHYAWC